VRELAARGFGALVRARERGYASGRLGVARLPRPVLSVGNLSTGGSGKTPTVIALGGALAARGLRFDVLTRGYRRASKALAIAQTGDEPVESVGDEPRLIAARLRAPVLVHPDRFRAGLEGERRFASQIHLLDDGFQHRQLARCFDLALVSPRDFDDRLLPAGRLREPLSALARASAVLWVETEGDLGAARRRCAAHTPAPVFCARRRVLPFATSGRRFAFAGIARPESFWASLAEAGIEVAGQHAFRDHHRYTAADLRRLRAWAAAAGADRLVTTAKDAMKLPPEFLADGVDVLEIEMEIPELPSLMQLALSACAV